MKALRFQTGWRHQKSPPSLRGDGEGAYIQQLHCHHLHDFRIEMGSDVSHFNVSLIVLGMHETVHKSQFYFLKRKMSRSWESNLRPSAYQPSALPRTPPSVLLYSLGSSVEAHFHVVESTWLRPWKRGCRRLNRRPKFNHLESDRILALAAIARKRSGKQRKIKAAPTYQ